MVENSSQDEGKGQDEQENLEEKAKRVRARKMLQKIKLQRSLTQCRSPGHDARAVYEVRINKLKKNNRELAKALADEKTQTNHWYTECFKLKGELHETREKLLVHTDNNVARIVQHEVEKQLKEIAQPLNEAIGTAIGSVVKSVDSLTKVKMLAADLTNIPKRSSSNSSLSLLRNSGSRLPLAPGSSTSSPQNVVLPMVSGHVLQPVHVPIQKLKIAWESKMRERNQATSRNEIDMSIIGEQSVVENETDESTTSALDDSADFENNTSINSQQNTPSPQEMEQGSSISRGRNSRSGGSLCRRGGRQSSRAGQRSTSPQSTSVLTSPVSSAHEISISSPTPSTSPTPAIPSSSSLPLVTSHSPNSPIISSPSPIQSMLSTVQLSPDLSAALSRRFSPSPHTSPTTALTTILSPSPEPSSRTPSPAPAPAPKDNGNPRSRGKAKANQIVEEDPLEGPSWWYCGSQRRGRGRGYSGSRGRVAARKSQGRGTILRQEKELRIASSSESDEDTKIIKPRRQSNKKSPLKTTPVKTKGSSKQLDESYLASPATMLARLEDLEAKRGRRARSKPDRSMNSTVSPHRKRQTMPLPVRGLTSEGDTSPVNSESLITPDVNLIDPNTPTTETLPRSTKLPDFYTTENDLTCINNTDMDLTQPIISKFNNELCLPCEGPESDKKQTAPQKRKFFKSNFSQAIEITKHIGKTPFDLSLIDASMVGIETFSVQKSIEKENLPPANQDLRRVSIVLQDCMKDGAAMDEVTPSCIINSQSESSHSGNKRSTSRKKKASSSSPSRKIPVKRKTLKLVSENEIENETNEDDDDDDDDVPWEPRGMKKKRARSSRKNLRSVGKKKCSPRKKLSAADKVEECVNLISDDEQVNCRIESYRVDKKRKTLKVCFVQLDNSYNNIVDSPEHSPAKAIKNSFVETKMEKPTEDSHDAELDMPTEGNLETEMERQTEGSHETEVERPTEDSHETEVERPTEDSHETKVEEHTEDSHETKVERQTEDSHETKMEMLTESSHETEVESPTKGKLEIKVERKPEDNHETSPKKKILKDTAPDDAEQNQEEKVEESDEELSSSVVPDDVSKSSKSLRRNTEQIGVNVDKEVNRDDSAPRRRRTAAMVTSYKERGLNCKLRQSKGGIIIGDSSSKNRKRSKSKTLEQ